MTKIEELEQKLIERIANVKECYEKEMKPFYDAKLGILNVSNLSKDQQNELINTRNCLLVQRATYEEILEYVRGYK
jgi:hypothetical protein